MSNCLLYFNFSIFQIHFKDGLHQGFSLCQKLQQQSCYPFRGTPRLCMDPMKDA
ncbi:unnamed protein product [Arctogadus glacialis]